MEKRRRSIKREKKLKQNLLSEQQSTHLKLFVLFSSNSAKLLPFLSFYDAFSPGMFHCGLEMIYSPLHKTPTTFIDFDHFSPLQRFPIQYNNVWTPWTHLCIEFFILPKEIDTQLSESDIDFMILLWSIWYELLNKIFNGSFVYTCHSSATQERPWGPRPQIFTKSFAFWSNVIRF